MLPILLWRDWRWLRWFAGALAIGVFAMCLINGPEVALFYLTHVLPPMSGGIADIQNKSIASAVGLLLHGYV